MSHLVDYKDKCGRFIDEREYSSIIFLTSALQTIEQILL